MSTVHESKHADSGADPESEVRDSASLPGVQRDLACGGLTHRKGHEPLPCDFLRQLSDAAETVEASQKGQAADWDWLRALEPKFGGTEAEGRLGVELEMFLFDARTGAPVGTVGARADLQAPSILQELARRYEASGQGTARLVRDPAPDPQSVSLAPSRDCPYPKGDVVYGLMLSEGLTYSIEPGGQFEIATPPRADVTQVRQWLRRAFELVEDVVGDDVLFLSHGTNPITMPSLELQVPKKRYRILTRYFASEPSGRGIDMMRHAATVQPNIDVASDRASWQEAVRLSYALSPMLKGLFPNSLFFRGQPVADGLERQRIWSGLDRTRAGVPAGLIDAADPSCAYACWAAQANVFLIDGLGEFEQPRYGEITFREWFERGYKGTRPGLADWERHLATLFPEVRLRGFLELRMLDAQPFERLIPLMAFVRGLLQSRGGRADVLGQWQALATDFATGRLTQVFDRLQRCADVGLGALGERVDGPARRAVAGLAPANPRSVAEGQSAASFVRSAGVRRPSLIV